MRPLCKHSRLAFSHESQQALSHARLHNEVKNLVGYSNKTIDKGYNWNYSIGHRHSPDFPSNIQPYRLQHWVGSFQMLLKTSMAFYLHKHFLSWFVGPLLPPWHYSRANTSTWSDGTAWNFVLKVNYNKFCIIFGLIEETLARCDTPGRPWNGLVQHKQCKPLEYVKEYNFLTVIFQSAFAISALFTIIGDSPLRWARTWTPKAFSGMMTSTQNEHLKLIIDVGAKGISL